MSHEHGKNCGCGHDDDILEEMEDDCCCDECDEDGDEEIILLVDEEGQEHPFVMFFVVELDNKAYAVLGSLEEEDLTIIMEMVGDEEDLELHPVEDEDELERVIDFVRQELENEFDEDDF
ncbi:MAG TPA: DUF1292 domain-containing protein [Firmicutes bacterium]|jgi:uncharacterized protein YrzB (UPF0473 family)|nr:DUF1292 domain-containing protein [Bacillota bacterium]